MDHSNPYSGLNFSFRARRIPGRAVTLGIAFAVFSIMWLVIPGGAHYWLLLPVVLSLVWIATYGWRPAVAELRRFLQFIERF